MLWFLCGLGALSTSALGRTAAGNGLVLRPNRYTEATPPLLLGSLDSDPGRTVDRHIWVTSKAPWVEIRDALPQEEGGAPFPERGD